MSRSLVLGALPVGLLVAALVAGAPAQQDEADRRSEAEVRARLADFNGAWEAPRSRVRRRLLRPRRRLELSPLGGGSLSFWPVRLKGATLSFRAGREAWNWTRLE